MITFPNNPVHNYFLPLLFGLCVYGLIVYDLLRPASTTTLTKKHIAMIIAVAALISAAVWFTSAILSFNSLSKEEDASWLFFSEKILLGASAILTLGLLGEWPDSESWKKTTLYTVAKFFVVAGVVIELLGDAGIFAANSRLDKLNGDEIANANKIAADAMERAATAEQKAADTLKEEIDLEVAISPREFNPGAVAQAISRLPRTPVVISVVGPGEPFATAQGIIEAFTGIKIGDTPLWDVKSLAWDGPPAPGINILYLTDSNGVATPSETLAETVCEILKSEGLSVGTSTIPSHGGFRAREWPSSVPEDAIIIKVGPKNSDFWWNKYLIKRSNHAAIPDMPLFCTAEEEKIDFFDRARKAGMPVPTK